MTTPLANASAIRASGYSARVFAAFYAPQTPVASGTIDEVAPFDPRIVLVVTYVTGAYTDAQQGMEVVFIDQITGNFKGRTHLAYGTTPLSANILPIREYALAQFDLNVGDTFQVFNEWRIHDKLPAAAVTFAPDYYTYSDQGSNPPPVACSGGHYAAWVDGYDTAAVLAYATVQMTGSTSYTVDPDSGGSVTHLWTLPTGVTFAGGSVNTDADPLLHAVPGGYLVYHAVTDSSNSKTTTQHIIIEVYDDTRPPYEVGIASYSGTQDGGFGFSLELMSGDGSLTAIPDGGWCILFTHEIVNGAWQAFRNAAPGRSTIIGVGIVRRDTNSGDSSGYNKLVFDVESPLARLHEMTSYSKAMLDGVLSEWDSVKTLSVKRAAEQIFLFYTTLIEAGCDIIFDAAFIDYRYPAFYLQRSDFVGQFNELINAVDAVISCDRTGRIDLHTYPAYIPLASRAAVTVSWHFVPNDILSWQFTREQIDLVEQMKVSGFTGGASNNQPIFALGPGAAPGEGLAAGDKARMIVADDGGTDITERAGRYQAEANLSFRDSDGTLYRLSELRLTLRGVYNFFDFRKEYADFTTTLTNRRSVDLTPFLFFLTNISVSFDSSGSPQTQLVFKPAFNASAGTLYIPPLDNFTPPPITPVQPPIVLNPVPGGGLIPSGVNSLALIGASKLALTANFNTPAAYGGPTYTAVTWGSLGVTGTPTQWVPNGFDPGSGWLVTSDEIGYLTLSTGAYSVKYSLGATITPNISADASFAEQNFFALVYNDTTDGTVCIHTVDNTTFTKTIVNANTANSTGQPMGIYVSSKTAGRIIVGAFTGVDTTAAYVSSNHGASWALLSPAFAVSCDGLFNVNVPWSLTNDNTYFYSAPLDKLGNPGSHRFYRQLAGTNLDISPVLGGRNFQPNEDRNVAEASVQNANRILSVMEDGGGTNGFAVVLTNNAQGALPTWTVVENYPSDARRCAISGNDPTIGWIWGVGNKIDQVTMIGTPTLDSRSGNLASLSIGEIISIAGV